MMLSRSEAESRYRKYIDCINDGTMESDLGLFCCDVVTHNDRRLSLSQYRQLIQEAKMAIPDIVFQVKMLVFDEETQMIAVILDFTGTPSRPIEGVIPSGKEVRFSEHVTYQLKDGKIEQVWSLVDWESARKQANQVMMLKVGEKESQG